MSPNTDKKDWNAGVVPVGPYLIWGDRDDCYCEGPREIEQKLTMEGGGMHGKALQICKRCGKLVKSGT